MTLAAPQVSEPPEDLLQLAEDLEFVEALIATDPLAGAVLWHRDGLDLADPETPRPRTSQRSAVYRLLSAPLGGYIFGGNRTGKSEALAMIGAAFARGRHDPAVIIFAYRNGIDLEAFPEDPQLIWVVCPTHADSIAYVRPKYERYLGPKATKTAPGVVWSGFYAQDQCRATMPNGCTVLFKATSQRRKAFQGDACDLIHFDEECLDEEVFEECLARLIDLSGRLVCSMTPLSGYTYTYRRYVETPDPDVSTYWLTGDDNPHVPAEALARIYRQLSSRLDSRRFGRFTVLEGAVYPLFDRNVHVVEPFEFPGSGWSIFDCADAGVTNPFALLRCFYDWNTDRLYVAVEQVAEMGHNTTSIENGERWIEEQGNEAELCVLDPSAAEARRNFEDLGMMVVPGNNAVLDGIDATLSRLTPDAEGTPRLMFFSTCPTSIAEHENYRWAKGKEAPLKVDDHTCDALRYLVMEIESQKGMGAT